MKLNFESVRLEMESGTVTITPDNDKEILTVQRDDESVQVPYWVASPILNLGAALG